MTPAATTPKPTHRRFNPPYQDADAVRRKRIAAGLSQSGLARLAGITQPHVSAIERGKSSAGVEVLQAIAKALKCPVEEIMYKRGKTGRR